LGTEALSIIEALISTKEMAAEGKLWHLAVTSVLLLGAAAAAGVNVYCFWQAQSAVTVPSSWHRQDTSGP
jgi:hypothetical protein